MLSTSEAGAPTYSPIKATSLCKVTTLNFDRLVSQPADLS